MGEDLIEHAIFVLDSHSTKLPAKLILNSKTGKLSIEFNDLNFEVEKELNFFKQIRKLDEKVNENGLKLLCNATSFGVFSIGLRSDWSRGVSAYTYDTRSINVFECSWWNKYASQKDQKDFYEFVKSKLIPVTKIMFKAKEQGLSKEKMLEIQDEWLRKKGITRDNFWKRELWE